jgi:predicted Zn-dependent peptidase
MKKLLTIALVLFVTNAWAQLDRSKLPTPSEAKEIKIGDYEKFELKNGLKVILVENHKLPTIAWTLTMSTGPITEGDNSGYTSMFGPIMRAGTTSKPKQVLDEEIDFMGASISVGSSSIFGFSLSKYKEDVLDIMTDILYKPAFPQEELEKLKKQNIAAIAQSKDDPNGISRTVSAVLNYGKDHTYGEIMTEATIENISMEDIKNHYDKFFKPNVAYLVIVGDIKKKDAQKLAKNYFGKWEQGEVNKEVFIAPVKPTKTIVAIVDRPASVQSVINITYPIDNKPGSADVTKLSVLNQILGGPSFSTRLVSNLREDKAYTYGANSSFGRSRYSGTFSTGASVRNEVTDSATVQFIYELERLRVEPVEQEELDLAKNSLRGSFARSLESRNTVAQFALNSELNDFPADYYANYLKRLDAITIEDIQATAKKYIKPEQAYIVVVGKAAEIAEKMKAFGEVKFYDAEGNPVEDPTKEVVSDVSVDDIFNKYIEAIGGRAIIDGIKTFEYSSKATLSIGGQSLDISRTVYQKSPDKFLDKTVIPMMGETKQIYNAGNGRVESGGQKMDLGGADMAPLKYLGVLYGERFYGELGYKVSYKGIKKVDGKDAHSLTVEIDGLTVTEMYDVESGLKVQFDMGAAGLYSLSDYKMVDGVNLAHKLIVKTAQIPMPLEFIIGEVKVNKEIDDSIFN